MGDAIRFGARRGDLRSGTFVVATSANTPDVYIMCRGVGRQARVSLHQSGSWRFSIEPISADTGEVMPPMGGETWTRPPPFVDGLTKVFGVIVPSAGVTRRIDDDGNRVRLVQVPRGCWGIQFTLILSDPGTPARSWPGAEGMRTTLIGRTELATGETLWVVAHEIVTAPTLDETPKTGKFLPGQDMDAAKESLESGTLRGLAFVVTDDGMRALMESAVVPREQIDDPG